MTGSLVLAGFTALPGFVQSEEVHRADESNWLATLISQASRLGLPTRFLQAIPPDFIAVEFADLRTFAAEYHPDTHHLVLNLALSFNTAGRALRPLAQMNHRDVATIYHELFHAYLDYVNSSTDQSILDADAQRLLAFAKEQQVCRYTSVYITPLPQKKSMTEPRVLSERESWEALNETWAVFVGWTIWNKLEVAGRLKGRRTEGRAAREQFRKLLKKADHSHELMGYYEPEDKNERAVTHKRYLAPANRITRTEVTFLFRIVLGEDTHEAEGVASVMAPDPMPAPGSLVCTAR